jgi:hypothetical protein
MQQEFWGENQDLKKYIYDEIQALGSKFELMVKDKLNSAEIRFNLEYLEYILKILIIRRELFMN